MSDWESPNPNEAIEHVGQQPPVAGDAEAEVPEALRVAADDVR